MLFNSLQYVSFFVFMIVIAWGLLKYIRLRLVLLLLGSYYFYVSHNYWLILLILLSTQIDYFCGKKIYYSQIQSTRKLYLIISLVANLGILAIFKYTNFFGGSIAILANTIGWQLSWVDKNIALPVGISFYTFQSMSYTIDIYRKEMPAEKSWVRFSLFVAYFPQLIAGPIVRAKNFLPQLSKSPNLTSEQLDESLFLIFRGFFKKMVLADFLAIYADSFFNAPGEAGALMAWLGMYAFAFQIYYDFSGYSDIAVGCAKLMGYQLPENFRRPYMATSLSNFWQRWHISLSTWLRDYLYRSLGGNRRGNIITFRNLMITMLLGGLWHGAAWTFVLWGLFHGILLVLERQFDIARKEESPSWKPVRLFVTFHLVCFSWLIFRSNSIVDLLSAINSLCAFEDLIQITNGMIVAMVIIVSSMIMQAYSEKKSYYTHVVRLPIPVRSAIYASITMLVTVFSGAGVQPFIYFQF